MTKKRTTRKAPARKAARKKARPAPRPYSAPKPALELGYLCKAPADAGECGRPPVWLDYELGRKTFCGASFVKSIGGAGGWRSWGSRSGKNL